MFQLQTIKESLSVDDFVMLLKTIANNLAFIGDPIPGKDLVLYALSGLKYRYH